MQPNFLYNRRHRICKIHTQMKETKSLNLIKLMIFLKVFFSQLESLTDSELKQIKLLREFIKDINYVCVAFSGGVDSSLVATIAHEQLGSKAFAVTGVSPSLAPY